MRAQQVIPKMWPRPWHEVAVTAMLLLLWAACPPVVLAQGLSPRMVAHAEAARNYMASGRWDFASHEWRLVLNEDPANLEAHLELARALREAGYVADAIRHLQEVRLTPKAQRDRLELDVSLAESHRQAGEPVQAATLYRQVLAAMPAHEQAFQKLKALLPELPQAPRNHRREAQKLLDGLAAQAFRDARKAIQARDYARAEAPLARALGYYERASLANNYALSLLLSGKRGEALHSFGRLRQSGIANGNERWEYLSNAAMASLAQGNPFQARALMEEAIGLCGDDRRKAALYNNLGYVYEAAKRSTSARYAYERALELDPGLDKARMNLAYIFQKERDFDRAIALYRELASRQPDNPVVWNRLGFAYELKSKSRDAIRAYEKALALDSKYQEAYYNLGTLYKKMNRMDEANAAFKTMMALEFEALEGAREQDREASEASKAMANLTAFVDVFFADMKLPGKPATANRPPRAGNGGPHVTR